MLPYVTITTVALGLLALLAFVILANSVHFIGEREVGLVVKRLAAGKLTSGNILALNGEAGYQADLLMPGLRWKAWPVYRVIKHPWVQVPAGEIGVVIAQIGEPISVGAKSAVYKKEFGDFTDVRTFLQHGGQKGVQRPVLPPGTLAPVHPVAFLVLTRQQVYGEPVLDEYRSKGDELSISHFDLGQERLLVTRITPSHDEEGNKRDVCGVVTTFEGCELPADGIAGRIGGFSDLEQLEASGNPPAEMIEALIATRNSEHNSYQDMQTFLEKKGTIGLQHDPLLYGAYNLNPFLVSVEIVPMLVVEQGQVAVVKSYVGLPTRDLTGPNFKFGSLVKPGHRGIWEEPLRTGKYPLNPRCYASEIVPTAILTLNWAEAVSQAHHLDKNLKQIIAKSREGFVFAIDLQVQIHVPDTEAARVISMVGTMQNLVNEVLQAAVGNHFRDTLQSMRAVEFIEQRKQVQTSAMDHISQKLQMYRIETKGVYIQDVVFPEDLVQVLTEREIANQLVETFKRKQEAETQRQAVEAAKGRADQQAALARSEIGVTITTNNAKARQVEAEGEASYIEKTGAAKAAEVRAVALAKAEGFEKQVQALGQGATALVNITDALAKSSVPIMPQVLVTGSGSSLEGLSAALTQFLMKPKTGATPPAPASEVPVTES